MNYKIRCKESGEIFSMTVSEILDKINEGHSDEFSKYDETDWREGFEEWQQPYGWEIIEEAAPKFQLGNCVEPSRSIPLVPCPTDIAVCFTLEELKALTQDFYTQNFECSDNANSNARSLEFAKRDTNIMLKMMYALEQHVEIAA